VKLAFVLGTTAGGTGRHVRMLVAGCAVRGVPAVVAGPRETGRDFGFGGTGGVTFEAVDFGGRPSVRDGLAVLRLRQALGRSGADVVHAHGLRAGALTALALALRPAGRPLPLVVTVHNAPPAAGASGAIYRALELIVARSADVILCVSADLEERMRRAGARDVGRALVPSPGHAPPREAETGEAIRRELGAGQPGGGQPGGGQPGGGRPLVLAAGRLAPQKGFATLIEAARRWQDLTPVPVLAVAGGGPLRAELATAAAPLGTAIRFLGHRDDVPALLAAADVFVLPSVWEGQPLILQEALRAGRPIVASRAGGIPDLTGEDGALLVPPHEPGALAAAVRRVLTTPSLAGRLSAAAFARARSLPSENDAVEAALAVYRRVTTAALAAGPGTAS